MCLFVYSVLDAWGKIPSEILVEKFFNLSQSSYDYGSFAQCFHIERKGRRFKTQYCLVK